MQLDANAPTTLTALFRARGLSDREVERRTGIARKTIRHWRQGKTGKPRWPVVSRLAEMLGLPSTDVLEAIGREIANARSSKARTP